jgi:trehalose 6-phosphate synthase
MNLVAKEWVAAQHPDSPGTLVLSQGVGAVHELKGAVVFDPRKPGDMARALDTALNMPLAERKDRHERNLAAVNGNKAKDWFERSMSAMIAVASGNEAMQTSDSFLHGTRLQGLLPKKGTGRRVEYP